MGLSDVTMGNYGKNQGLLMPVLLVAPCTLGIQEQGIVIKV